MKTKVKQKKTADIPLSIVDLETGLAKLSADPKSSTPIYKAMLEKLPKPIRKISTHELFSEFEKKCFKSTIQKNVGRAHFRNMRRELRYVVQNSPQTLLNPSISDYWKQELKLADNDAIDAATRYFMIWAQLNKINDKLQIDLPAFKAFLTNELHFTSATAEIYRGRVRKRFNLAQEVRPETNDFQFPQDYENSFELMKQYATGSGLASKDGQVKRGFSIQAPTTRKEPISFITFQQRKDEIKRYARYISQSGTGLPPLMELLSGPKYLELYLDHKSRQRVWSKQTARSFAVDICELYSDAYYSKIEGHQTSSRQLPSQFKEWVEIHIKQHLPNTFEPLRSEAKYANVDPQTFVNIWLPNYIKGAKKEMKKISRLIQSLEKTSRPDKKLQLRISIALRMRGFLAFSFQLWTGINHVDLWKNLTIDTPTQGPEVAERKTVWFSEQYIRYRFIRTKMQKQGREANFCLPKFLTRLMKMYIEEYRPYLDQHSRDLFPKQQDPNLQEPTEMSESYVRIKKRWLSQYSHTLIGVTIGNNEIRKHLTTFVAELGQSTMVRFITGHTSASGVVFTDASDELTAIEQKHYFLGHSEQKILDRAKKLYAAVYAAGNIDKAFEIYP